MHGDLQPGNILITAQSELRLVDYDGMAVPGMIGELSPEVGMPPYQHPRRNADTRLVPSVDNFSALMIYVALRALAATPELWRRHVTDRSSDKLLFHEQDVAAGRDSLLFRELQSLGDAEIAGLAAELLAFAAGPLENVPTLDQIIQIQQSHRAERRLATTEEIQQLLRDSAIDRARLAAAWHRMQELGADPASDLLAAEVLPHLAYQQTIARLEDLFAKAPQSPTFVHDQQLIAAWESDAVESAPANAAAWSKSHQAAEQRLALHEGLWRLTRAGGATVASEQEIIALARRLPPSYDPRLLERLQLAEHRLNSLTQLRAALRPPGSDLSIAIAWRAAERYGAQSFVGQADCERIDLALARVPLLRALSEQISDSLPPEEIDRRLLRLWNEPLLHDCADARLWRSRYQAALLRNIPHGSGPSAHRIDEDIRQALILANGRSRPAEPRENRWLLRYQTLIEATGGGNLRQAAENFNLSLARLACQQTPSTETAMTGLVQRQILPGIQRALSKSRADAVTKLEAERWRIHWDWPPVGWLDACLVAICQAPAGTESPADDACLWVTRVPAGDQPTGRITVNVPTKWQGAYVVIWAEVDLGYKSFVVPPVNLGRIQ